MADVHGRRLLTVFGGLVLLKTLDLASRGADWWLLLVWMVAGAALILGYKWAPMTVSAISVTAFMLGFENQHMWLFIFLPWTFYAPAADRDWLWRWQVTIVYGFAAVAKLTPDYLSGSVMERRLPGIPTLILIGLSVAGLLTEGFLAFCLWRWKWAKVVGVGFHVVVIAVMATGLVHGIRLFVFGGLVVLLYAAFPSDARGARRQPIDEGVERGSGGRKAPRGTPSIMTSFPGGSEVLGSDMKAKSSEVPNGHQLETPVSSASR